MYKQLYSITLAGLIGVSAGLYGAGTVPVAADKASSSAPTGATADGAVVTIQTLDGSNTPMLIDFNQQLYKECCEGRQEQYFASFKSKLQWTVVPTLMMIGFGTYQLAGLPNFSAAFIGACSAFWQDGLLMKLWNTHRYVITGLSLLAGIYTTTTCATDYSNWLTWGEREDLVTVDQQKMWHQFIYALFGRPEVVGEKPLTGKYILKGYKRYGAGQVIFDPFDHDQVKILLGIGRAQENLSCSKLEIIPIEEPTVAAVVAVEVEEVKTEVQL